MDIEECDFRKICEAIDNEFWPESFIMPMPPVPVGVATAAIVESFIL